MAERKIRNLTSDYLTCTICWNTFTDPKMLECGHSYCAKCLEDYIRIIRKQRDCFECPICRHPHDLTPETDPLDMVRSLTSDTISISILQAIGVRSSEIFKLDDTDIATNVSHPETKVQTKEDDPFCACARHQEKPLDVYCSKHDIVICSECARQDHAGPECECSSAQTVIKKRLNALNCLVAQQSSDASRLFDSENTEVKTIRSMHDEIQKCITDVEEGFNDIFRSFKSRVESIRKKAKETVEHDLSSSEVRRLQEHLIAKVKTFDSEAADLNPNDVLKMISELCLDSSELQQNLHELTQKVKTGSLMKYAETDLNILDAFVSGVRNTLPSEFLSLDENYKNEPNEKEFVIVTDSGAFEDFYTDNKEGPSEISQQITFSAKLQDEEKCMLSGIALIGTSAVTIVDQANKKLKKFKIPEGKFLNELLVDDEPHQVATLRDSSDVAVSLWDIPKILIVSTDPVLTVTRVIDTPTEYIGLTSHVTDSLAASSILSRRVDVLNTSENNFNRKSKRDTIYQSSRRRSFPDRLASTQDGKVVIRNRRRNEVSCFGRNRMLLWSRRLKYSVADVTCFRGRVFASFRDKNDLVSFREDGQGTLEHLETHSLVKHPWALDGFKDCLVVTEDSPSDLVHILVFA